VIRKFVTAEISSPIESTFPGTQIRKFDQITLFDAVFGQKNLLSVGKIQLKWSCSRRGTQRTVFWRFICKLLYLRGNPLAAFHYSVLLVHQ